MRQQCRKKGAEGSVRRRHTGREGRSDTASRERGRESSGRGKLARPIREAALAGTWQEEVGWGRSRWRDKGATVGSGAVGASEVDRPLQVPGEGCPSHPGTQGPVSALCRELLPVPGGCGTREERRWSRHHVHSQLRGGDGEGPGGVASPGHQPPRPSHQLAGPR